MAFYLLFIAVFILTLAGGGAATGLTLSKNPTASGRRVAEKLAQIALIGAAALAALLGSISIP